MKVKGREMRDAGQGWQIEFLIEVPVDVFAYTVHARRVFSLTGFPGQCGSPSLG